MKYEEPILEIIAIGLDDIVCMSTGTKGDDEPLEGDWNS